MPLLTDINKFKNILKWCTRPLSKPWRGKELNDLEGHSEVVFWGLVQQVKLPNTTT